MLIKTARLPIIAGLLLAALATACTPTPSPTPTLAPTATASDTPTATVTSTNTPTATVTNTLTPTITLVPTKAPTRRPPTKTPEPAGSTTEAATEAATQAATEAPTEAATEAPTAAPQGDSFAPTVAQVWNLDRDPFSKSSTDACGGDLAVDFYGLIGVRPDGDNLVWHRQDGNDYTLVKVSLNHYSGAGPSSVQDFNLSISVTFTSATTLVASHTLTSISNPDCQHTYKYNAQFKWNS